MPKSKFRRVPDFLKEIFIGYARNTQGDFPDEWDYAEFQSGGAREDWDRAQNNWNSNYLGWWKRGNRGVYYFGDHKTLGRPEEQNLWDVYYWYKNQAKSINETIESYNSLIDLYNSLEKTGFKITKDSRPVIFTRPTVAVLSKPPHMQDNWGRDTVGINKWLHIKNEAINKELANLVNRLDNYNYDVERFKEKEKRDYEEKLRREKEDKETKRFYELKSTIDDTDRRLTKNINQLRTDIMGRLGEQKSLFSELSSAHDQDTRTIAQFNEALMENSKLEISMQSDVTSLQKDVKSTQLDVDRLRMYESFNSKDIQKNQSAIQNLTQVVKKKLPDEISDLRKDVTMSLSRMYTLKNEHQAKFETIDKVLKENQQKYKETRNALLNHKENIVNVSKRLDEIKKKHYTEQNKLEAQLKEQERVNKTYFDAYKAQSDVYEKDVSQLKFELDKQDSENKEQGKRNEARFKTLFEYHAYTDRQVKKQNKKTSNFAQLKRIRQMPDKATALKNYRRGRYALLQEYV
jgi:chromosome segregation ATPase